MTAFKTNSYFGKILKSTKIFCALLFFSALISCHRAPKTLHILSDRSELAIAVEMYSKIHPEIRITFCYVPHITMRQVQIEKPDIIIGKNINTPDLLELFKPWDFSMSDYSAFHGPKNEKGQPLLQPLAFNLPLIVGMNETMMELPDPVIIRYEHIRDAGLDFIQRNPPEKLTYFGFSPTWNPATYLDFLFLNSSNAITEDFNSFDDAVFLRTAEALQKWIVEVAGSIEAERTFSEQYRYVPDVVLVNQGKIQFARIDFETWSKLNSTMKKNLQIRYFSGKRHIPIISVVWAALLTRMESNESREFILWLADTENQMLLMDRWEANGINVFGFLGGLSTQSEINEMIIVERNPAFNGMIPENHFMKIQPILPEKWSRIRDEVIYPWFVDYIYSSGPLNNISDKLATWELSSLDKGD